MARMALGSLPMPSCRQSRSRISGAMSSAIRCSADPSAGSSGGTSSTGASDRVAPTIWRAWIWFCPKECGIFGLISPKIGRLPMNCTE